ncbi:hypothetical protein CGT73_17650 [Vibrio cholerae]|nr:hypothetical protein CGT79_17655 [Vibrio cholerae]PAS19725.1 hypothetical protein CGT73_17650 [Vibrio cholerae]
MFFHLNQHQRIGLFSRYFSFLFQRLKRTSVLYTILHTGRVKTLNARLRGWQRITTKLKHNNCNHRGSMGLETPRVDSPS